MTNINTFFFERFVSCAEREREKKERKNEGKVQKGTPKGRTFTFRRAPTTNTFSRWPLRSLRMLDHLPPLVLPHAVSLDDLLRLAQRREEAVICHRFHRSNGRGLDYRNAHILP